MAIRFTRRERLILRLLCEGFSSKDIADELEISVGTTHTHIRNLYHKAGVVGDRQLILYAVQQPGALSRGKDCQPGLHPYSGRCLCLYCLAMRAADPIQHAA